MSASLSLTHATAGTLPAVLPERLPVRLRGGESDDDDDSSSSSSSDDSSTDQSDYGDDDDGAGELEFGDNDAVFETDDGYTGDDEDN